jgi:hypothetical protein
VSISIICDSLEILNLTLNGAVLLNWDIFLLLIRTFVFNNYLLAITIELHIKVRNSRLNKLNFLLTVAGFLLVFLKGDLLLLTSCLPATTKIISPHFLRSNRSGYRGRGRRGRISTPGVGTTTGDHNSRDQDKAARQNPPG